MSARDFNPTGNPRRWKGVPGVKYPEEVAAEKMREKEERERYATRPAHCPAGYIQTWQVCLLLHLSETRTREVLKQYGVEYVQVVPAFGCPYKAWPEREVLRIRADREEFYKKRS